MDANSTPPKFIARYALSNRAYKKEVLRFIPASGLTLLALAILLMTSGQTSKGLLPSLMSQSNILILMGLIAADLFAPLILAWLTMKHTIEATTVGTLDFISRVKRVAMPLTALLRIEGFTTEGGVDRQGVRYRPSEYARFVFATNSQKERNIDIFLPMRTDPALMAFVRRLKQLNPHIDSSKFWA